MEELEQQIFERRQSGEDFSDIAHSLDLSNSEARRLYQRAKRHSIKKMEVSTNGTE